MSRVSQAERLQRALATLRSVEGTKGIPEFKALPTLAARMRVAQNLRLERWTSKTFYGSTMAVSWKRSKDMLDVLHELSYYLTPRAAWARRRQSGDAWVRREMAWSLLALVQHKLGVAAGKELRKAFVANGVKHRPRRTMTDEQKVALAQRSGFAKPVKATIVALGDGLPLGSARTPIVVPKRKPLVPVAPAAPRRRRYDFDGE